MSLALTFKRLATSLLPEVLLVADIRDVSNAEVRYLSKWVDSKPTVLGFNVGVLAGLMWGIVHMADGACTLHIYGGIFRQLLPPGCDSVSRRLLVERGWSWRGCIVGFSIGTRRVE